MCLVPSQILNPQQKRLRRICSVLPDAQCERCSVCRWNEAFCWRSVPQRDVQNEVVVSTVLLCCSYLREAWLSWQPGSIWWLPTAVVLASPQCSCHVASRLRWSVLVAFCQLRILNCNCFSGLLWLNVEQWASWATVLDPHPHPTAVAFREKHPDCMDLCKK